MLFRLYCPASVRSGTGIPAALDPVLDSLCLPVGASPLRPPSSSEPGDASPPQPSRSPLPSRSPRPLPGQATQPPVRSVPRGSSNVQQRIDIASHTIQNV
eukprot:scaffold3052_cov389-Prasinococcus_capsulatus_cf.AAC.16